ncbi:MAG: MotA/TolQ/ExbB proton channel family protein [Nitrospinae bacterium]|nr:MotA/TolQ/ExbB proton channel family protein [Nitrospinota bacterium]
MGVSTRTAALLSFAAFVALDTAPAHAAALFSPDEFWIAVVFRKGGPMMWPILLCSLFSLAIAIERALHLREKNVIHPEFLKEVRLHWIGGDIEKALKTCRNHDIAMSRIVRAGLLRANMGVLEIERAIEGAGGHESMILTANLRWLGAIANIATLLGLLGTVTGMIRSFNVIATAGPGNLSLVATGIAEALVATAAGLAVGIPTFAAYHFLRGKADRLVLKMEDISIGFVEDMVAGKKENA